MANKFSEIVAVIFQLSKKTAISFQSESVKPIHLALAILQAKSAQIEQILKGLHADEDKLIEALTQYAAYQPTYSAQMAENDIPYDATTEEIIRNAITSSVSDNIKVVNEVYLFRELLNKKVPHPTQQILTNHHVTYNAVNGFILNYIQRKQMSDSVFSGDDEDDSIFDFDDNEKEQPGNGSRSNAHVVTGKGSKTPILDKFSHDLTKAAKEDLLDPVVGRQKEINRVVEILSRRKKNNPILIGEPGVGKSAIVEGLAQLISQQQASPTLFGKRVVELDLAGIVAGTKYRGQFEERIKGIVKELENDPDIIIFIDEIHTLIGAGNSQGGIDAANILKPALARGVIQCIGATTFQEYRKTIEKDGALERRFQKVSVNPTTPEETLQILRNIKDRYEKHHKVSYSDAALEECIRLTDRYVSDRFFPDKAIDVLDEVGAHVHLSHSAVPESILNMQRDIDKVKIAKQKAVANQNFELAASYRDQQARLENLLESMKLNWEKGDVEHYIPVGEHDVAEVLSRMTGVPVQRMEEAENTRLRNMADTLKSYVVAQDEAINTMVKAIQRNRIGLKAPNHPIGTFMFLGPTGVGKTYLAKKLAEEMFGSPEALIRIDMSEYSESFNTSRLIGAPPGYVGYDEGGQLTERVRRHPYSIVLLDEIEKANEKVFNMLLQVLDEGRLTDGNGRLVDFRNTIIIMTSNAGTRQLKEFGRGVGFNAGRFDGECIGEKDKEYARSIVQKSLSKQFAPEFLNRLDEIITFDQLDLSAIKRIIDIELRSLHTRIKDMGYEMRITDKAKEFVATKGYDVQFGARPLKRAIQTYVEDGICELLMEGHLKKGDIIVVGKHSNKEGLTFTAKEESI